MRDKKGFRLQWELRQSASKDEAEIMIYSEICSYQWCSEDVTASGFDKALKEAKKSGATKLRLRINSPGGDVWQAVAMKTMLETSDFEEINIDIEGLCASAATFFCCIAGAKVRIASGSEFMIHNPATGVWGTAAAFQKTANRLVKMEEEQHGWYAKRTGQTEEQIKAWMDDTTWFTAKEAVEYGFCDELIQAESVAACASPEEMGLMRELYQSVPEGIQEKTNVSNGDTPVASGDPTEYQQNHEEEEEGMEINEITEQQLLEGNPELHRTILQRGQQLERTRMQEIDALTAEGFEELAEEAKKNGTSAADFLKQVVAKQAERRSSFLAARNEETKPASQVAGGAAEDNNLLNQKEELDRYAKEMAAMAADISRQRQGGMY